MDWTAIIASSGSFILGIGVVSTFFGKYLPVAKKYIGIASDAISLINAFESALTDEKITDEEINDLKARAIRLRDDFKK